MKANGLRHVRVASLAATAVWLCASAAFAADKADTAGTRQALASPPPREVLTPSGVGVQALRLHLAQTLGPDSERESHRYRQTVFGSPVEIGTSHGSALAGPRFAHAHPRDSATFEKTAATGGLGLLNVAWLGVRRLSAD